MWSSGGSARRIRSLDSFGGSVYRGWFFVSSGREHEGDAYYYNEYNEEGA